MSIRSEISKLLYRNYFTKNSFKIYKRKGVKFLLSLENDIDRKLIFKGLFEKKQLQLMLSAAKCTKPDYFIDVGANLGLYSILIANSGFVDKVISFEPDAQNYSQLRSNILINGLGSKITAYEKGLSNIGAIEDFYKNKGRDTGTSRIKKTAPTGISMEEFDVGQIEVVRFDSLMQLDDKNLFIKIDIEGHEICAIEGMKKTLMNNKCRLQVEVFEENFKSVDGLLTSMSYKEVLRIGVDRIYSNTI